MRIATSSITSNSLANLQGAISRYQAAQNTASTGRRIARPSDGPAGAAEAMSTRSQLARLAQYATNADSGTSLLASADSVLQNASSQLDSARSVALQAMNTGGATDPAAAAAQISALRQSLLGLANTVVGDTPLFAGSSGVSQAYAADGAYQGDGGSLTRQVGPDTRVSVTTPGTTVFGANGQDAFSVLAQISAHLTDGTGVTAADLTALDGVRSSVSAALTTVGTTTNRIASARSAATSATATLTSALSDLEDVDAPTALIALQTRQVAYQSALAATGKIMQTSLLDFLK